MARLGIGAVLLLIGVLGGFVPILQGWIFVLAGLGLMAPESELARRALSWCRRRLGRGDVQAPPGGGAV